MKDAAAGESFTMHKTVVYGRAPSSSALFIRKSDAAAGEKLQGAPRSRMTARRCAPSSTQPQDLSRDITRESVSGLMPR